MGSPRRSNDIAVDVDDDVDGITTRTSSSLTGVQSSPSRKVRVDLGEPEDRHHRRRPGKKKKVRSSSSSHRHSRESEADVENSAEPSGVHEEVANDEAASYLKPARKRTAPHLAGLADIDDRASRVSNLSPLSVPIAAAKPTWKGRLEEAEAIGKPLDEDRRAVNFPVVDKVVEKESFMATRFLERASSRQYTATIASTIRHTRFRRLAVILLEKRWFKIVVVISVVVALFGSPLFALLNVPDDPGQTILDVVMMTILIIFLFELLLTSYARCWHYIGTPFFWMDLLGLLSMPFEVSFLLGNVVRESRNGGDSQIDTVLPQVARAAKIGARLGRLAKTVKFVTAWLRHETIVKDDVKDISKKLTVILSMKVAFLVLLLMFFSPLFQLPLYPQADFSMKGWIDTMEVTYHKEAQAAIADFIIGGKVNSSDDSGTLLKEYQAIAPQFVGSFASLASQVKDFYKDRNYVPYHAVGYPESFIFEGVRVSVPGEKVLTRDPPARRDSIFRQVVASCSFERPSCRGSEMAYVLWDFTVARRWEGLMDIIFVIFMMAVMVFCTFDLSRTLDTRVLHPLTRLMSLVRRTTADILKQVSLMVSVDVTDSYDYVDKNVDEDLFEVSELQMLEMVLHKLASYTKLCMQENVVDEEEIQNLSLEGRGILVDMLRLNVETKSRTDSNESLVGRSLSTQEFAETLRQRISVEEDILDSWSFDVLSHEAATCESIVFHIFVRSAVGRRVRNHLAVPVLQEFVRDVRSKYQDQPYHNWHHAVDVLFAVNRFLEGAQGNHWVSSNKELAMLVAALGHDMGHFGRTNQFLMETRHELALRYNDQSPLENMHCASLFETCTKEGMAIFGCLEHSEYISARKVCIQTILHTDNAYHFEMVKEVSKIYEIADVHCDHQASLDEFTPEFLELVLRKNEMTFLQLFLHLADVSNPTRPFSICKAWAERVMSEFFDQGDEEKALGIPVGMLNDRSKVNFASSQHGFINFLVSPLVFASVRIFDSLAPLAEEMVVNMRHWMDIWKQDSSPTAEEVTARENQIAQARKTVSTLLDRRAVYDVREYGSGRRVSLMQFRNHHVEAD